MKMTVVLEKGGLRWATGVSCDGDLTADMVGELVNAAYDHWSDACEALPRTKSYSGLPDGIAWDGTSCIDGGVTHDNPVYVVPVTREAVGVGVGRVIMVDGDDVAHVVRG